jgi:hypothetical protein
MTLKVSLRPTVRQNKQTSKQTNKQKIIFEFDYCVLAKTKTRLYPMIHNICLFFTSTVQMHTNKRVILVNVNRPVMV